MLSERNIIFLLLLFFCIPAESQTRDDKISRLIAAENYFCALAKEKGIKKAFLEVSDENTILFRPGPVKALDFYKGKATASGYLSWQPNYAKISKSDDWGFTSGPYIFKTSDTSSVVSYGDYLSVWKKNKKGVFRLALDIGIPHKKPVTDPPLTFLNPVNDKFLHQYGSGRLRQREDIVFSSDNLYATILKADNKVARKEFLADETRLLFPGYEPVNGKAAVTIFWEKMQLKLTTEPQKADRAFSGELAFTHGNATLTSKGQTKKYYYVRIWEVQPGFKWSVIEEVFTPAEN